MRILTVMILAIGMTSPLLAQGPKRTPVAKPPGEALPKANAADASYSIGYRIGSNFKRKSLPIDGAALIKGLQEGMAGTKPTLNDEEMDNVLKAFEQEVSARIPEQNKKDGEAFLAANAKAEGVKTTKSGLQYKVLKEGTGKSPAKADTVTAHYKGTLIDGTPFDSSYERGEPLKIPVGGVIPGWTEALQLMKVGSKWILYVPSDLAYGPNGSPPVIGPNATLIFEVELLGIGG
ncbi:MAG TPA: FKBP-type peptidyl-prolyl cis-trans isomerase [Pirellulales bacterium]